MRKFFALILISVFLHAAILPVYAYTCVPEYLCQLGLQFYLEGRYDDALYEFKNALLAQPDNKLALKYIAIIQEEQGEQPQTPDSIYPIQTESSGLQEASDLIPDADYSKVSPGYKAIPQETRQSYIPEFDTAKVSIEKTSVPGLVVLDETFKDIPKPIELEQDRSIIIRGSNIQRFLATQPDIVTVTRRNDNEVLVTCKEIGYSYVHVWDAQDRWTVDFLGIFPKPEAPTFEELRKQEEELARSFKWYYSIDWSSFETGRRLRKNTLRRTAYSWIHGLRVTGQTPYGDFDSAATVRSVATSTDLTYYTIGLTNGRFKFFKDFSLRGFDYSLPFSNLAFSGSQLRGISFNTPVFNKKLDYTLFWGREGGGRYGNLSPSLGKTKNSFLEGANVSLTPTQHQNYKFTVVHGHGRDRGEDLNPYGYDLYNTWNFDKWGAHYEIANDSETFAHVFETHQKWPLANSSISFRNVDTAFQSITGNGWAQGQIGGILSVNYQPDELWNTYGSLDIYKERLYPAEEKPNRLNEDFNWNTSYQSTPDTNLNFNYSLQNDLGKLAQSRYITTGLGITQKMYFMKDMYGFANYYHQISNNFSSPASDYVNDRFFAGIRFNLIDALYFYANKELNLLKEDASGVHYHPHATETGVDYYSQIGATPFYGNMRFYYRDEESADSTLGFLSGEDSIEGHLELTYRATDYNEIYAATTIRNIWADKETVDKRIEANFNVGMRCMWDSNYRWETVGNIEGYVFKDENSDGLMQKNEAPVYQAKIWLGNDDYMTTDVFGYYSFRKIKAHKAYVSFDTSSLLPGFVLTVPVSQEVLLSQHRIARVDFGIISRAEVSGTVFEDTDNDGKYTLAKDKTVSGAVITLENGKQITTDSTGKFYYPNVSVGKHTINLDLNSLPIYYLPKSAITHEFQLFEGATYIYNIPLKKIQS
ncbi:MAG: pilus assembly protein N-terminal domain-containing protein [Candidatus Omnitrophota bacterium]|jgi:hypothetical protein